MNDVLPEPAHDHEIEAIARPVTTVLDCRGGPGPRPKRLVVDLLSRPEGLRVAVRIEPFGVLDCPRSPGGLEVGPEGCTCVRAPLHETSRNSWRTLALLLKDPMQGLAVLGVRALPPCLSGLADAGGTEGPEVRIVLRGTDLDDPKVQMVVLGFRALAERSGARFEVGIDPDLGPGRSGPSGSAEQEPR